LRRWEQHRRTLIAEEKLGGTIVGMMPWLEPETRFEILTDWEREAGIDVGKSDGVTPISIDDFRAEIGAGPPRGQKKES